MKNKDEVKSMGRTGFYAVLFESFRKAALECGWALGLHGSMATDMDMMAMPWTDDAKPPEELVKAISDCIDCTIWKDRHTVAHIGKPHGRIVYTISIYDDFYVDLSIMPFNKKEEKKSSNYLMPDGKCNYTGNFCGGSYNKDSQVCQKCKNLQKPTTLQEAVDFFIPAFEGCENLFEKNEDSFAAFCHSQLSGGIGMSIRNDLELWDEKSVMHQHMKTLHNCKHPDDMSDKILREIYKKVNNDGRTVAKRR
jgi:hypothetical protein